MKSYTKIFIIRNLTFRSNGIAQLSTSRLDVGPGRFHKIKYSFQPMAFPHVFGVIDAELWALFSSMTIIKGEGRRLISDRDIFFLGEF